LKYVLNRKNNATQSQANHDHSEAELEMFKRQWSRFWFIILNLFVNNLINSDILDSDTKLGSNLLAAQVFVQVFGISWLAVFKLSVASNFSQSHVSGGRAAGRDSSSSRAPYIGRVHLSLLDAMPG
jgi:hypothetical protein